MLVIPESARIAIAADAVRRYPLEACGILVGKAEVGRAVVRELRVEENVHDGGRRRRFEIAPASLLRAQKEARAAGLEVIGYYHSHPDAEAVPSSFDRETAWPDVSYLIVAVENGAVGALRSWRLETTTGAFSEEKIEYEVA